MNLSGRAEEAAPSPALVTPQVWQLRPPEERFDPGADLVLQRVRPKRPEPEARAGPGLWPGLE